MGGWVEGAYTDFMLSGQTEITVMVRTRPVNGTAVSVPIMAHSEAGRGIHTITVILP